MERYIHIALRLCAHCIYFAARTRKNQNCAWDREHDSLYCSSELPLSHPRDHRRQLLGSEAYGGHIETLFLFIFVLLLSSFLLFYYVLLLFNLPLAVSLLYFILLSRYLSPCPFSTSFLRLPFILSSLFYYSFFSFAY
jgi:hypothetical protein